MARIETLHLRDEEIREAIQKMDPYRSFTTYLLLHVLIIYKYITKRIR